MKEKLTRNLSLKIFAVLVAAGLWLLSININDPYQSKPYLVTVQILNMNMMTSAGKYVEVMDETDKISVTVRASRSVMDNFSSANIVATADLADINENNQVPIKLSSNNAVESIRSDARYVTVNVEDIRRVQKKIEVQEKNQPAEGYILGRTYTEQNALKISGPQSLVDNVAKAVVTFDVDGATDDVSMTLPIELYDKDGRRLIDNRLTLSITEVKGTASILATKEVPLVITPTGKPKNGYMLTGEIKSQMEKVRIAGRAAAIRNISQVTVEDALDITSLSEDVQILVDVRKYLPEGVVLVDAEAGSKVAVTAYIEKIAEKTLEVNSNRIKVINVPVGFKGEIVDLGETVEITLTGLEKEIAKINPGELNGYIDIQELLERRNLTEPAVGIYAAEVIFELPEGVKQEKTLSADVAIDRVQ